MTDEMKSFFNTINLSGNKLKESRDKCSQQQLDVLTVENA